MNRQPAFFKQDFAFRGPAKAREPLLDWRLG